MFTQSDLLGKSFEEKIFSFKILKIFLDLKSMISSASLYVIKTAQTCYVKIPIVR